MTCLSLANEISISRIFHNHLSNHIVLCQDPYFFSSLFYFSCAIYFPFSSMFKGKLCSGHLAAIKLLG
uniref:Uncharacterized protein n=1 Tax=Rhizophora mucronata TaxID=61149 RepID=A0A2P2Q451_RHIMU